jgi:hypothetical protein
MLIVDNQIAVNRQSAINNQQFRSDYSGEIEGLPQSSQRR